MERPFPSYQGTDPYVFVSYAHEDSALVYPELTFLNNAGFNIWYDEGIAPGTSWREELANAINDCSLFLIFITPRSATSANCLKEANFAENHGRRFLAIHLEETELSLGMELSLSDRQAVMRYELRESDYRGKLTHTLGEIVTRTDPQETIEHEIASRTYRLAPISIALGLGLLMIIGWLFTQNRMMQEPLATPEAVVSAATEAEAGAPVIAIMPFENLSPSEENAYFASGMHHDLLFNLSKIPGLLVIARTSVMVLAESGKRSSEIAEELGATHLLTGSVRRAGDQIRLSVILIDGQSETQIWAERYDRQLTDVFAIQSEISNQITNALQVTMDVGVAERIQSRPVEQFAAYDLLMQGRELARIGSSDAFEDAVELFERAIQIEPGYTGAHALRAMTLADTKWMTETDWLEVKETAVASAERALALDDQSFEAQLAMGVVLFRGRSYSQALPYFERAVNLSPNDSLSRAYLGWTYGNMGDGIQAEKHWSKAFELDPLSPETTVQIAAVLEIQGNLDGAASYFRRAVELAPDSIGPRVELMIFTKDMGDHSSRLSTALEVLELEPGNISGINHLVRYFSDVGEFDLARRWLSRIRPDATHVRNALLVRLLEVERDHATSLQTARNWYESNPNSPDAQMHYAFALGRSAAVAQANEQQAQSIAMREQSRALLLERLAPSRAESGEILWNFRDQWAISSLMVTSKSLGYEEEAHAIAEMLVEHYQTQPAAWRYGFSLHASMAFLMLGQREQAVDAFTKLLDAPGFTETDIPDGYGMGDDVYGVLSGMGEDIAYQQTLDRIRARNAASLATVRQEVPEAFNP